MKKLIISLIFSFILVGIHAQATEHFLRITISDRSDLETLTRMVSIDNVTGNEVIAYANSRQLEKLQNSSFQFVELEHPSAQVGRAITMATTIEQMANWDRYPTYDVYNQLMRKFVVDYPNLCKLDTVGTSVRNRNILALNLTSDISTPKAKPEVLLSSTMHGDEITGWILCMRLAYHLMSNYGIDTRITNMLDSISIFIVPNTNPDGTYYGSDNNVASARRSNYNGYDLNRNFPDPWIGPNPDGPWQKETIVMMDYAATRYFILSANYHGGIEVANYPWDGWRTNQKKHPDNIWYLQTCRQYATLAQTYGPSNYFKGLNNGVTNGGDWYIVYGGRQDYMNYWHNCREITLEISNTKMPGSETMPTYWNANREAMLAYIENAKYGIRGLITNMNGEPLHAKVTVVGHDQDNTHVYTNPVFGNYYRMIQPGTFTFLFESYGYEPQTFSGITSQQSRATILNVTMSETSTYTIHGIVVNSKTGTSVENVTIKVKNTSITPITTNESGNFTFNIAKGTYQFAFSKEGFLSNEQVIEINEYTDFLLITLDPFDGFSFEDGNIPLGLAFSGNQSWYITDNTAYHGVRSIRSGNITHNQTSTMIYTFNTIAAGKVTFASKVSSETGYDFLSFYINGTLKDRWSGEIDWAEYSYDVPEGSHTLQWTYSKDNSVNDGSDCAWVDFISLPNHNQNAVPVVNPQNITLETHTTEGETVLSLWNIGNANMNFSAVIEDAQNNNWLTLSNHSGTLDANQKNDMILSYNFTSLPNEIYTTNVLIDISGHIITVPVCINYPLGITNRKNDYSLVQVYPNPATNDVTISIPNNTGIAHIEILTFIGQKIHSCIFMNRHETFAIPDLGIKSSGVYFIKIQTDRFFETVKLVVEY